MILLDLSNPFKFTLKDQNGNKKVLEGTFREYTKEEHLEAKNKHKNLMKKNDESQKLVRELVRLNEKKDVKNKLEDYEAVDALIDQIAEKEEAITKLGKSVDLDVMEEGLKFRFELCLGGKSRDDILELAERVGYAKVYEKIVEGVQEGKPKPKNA